MRKYAALAFALAAAFLASCTSTVNEASIEEPEREMPYVGFFTEDFCSDTLTVRSGETFTSLLSRLGLDAVTSRQLIQKCDTVFDVRRAFKAGNRVIGYYTPDTLRTLSYVVYDHNRVKSTVFRLVDSLSVWNAEKPVTHERKVLDVTITSSLWNDMIAAGDSPLLIVDLADIYAWTVNFFALQSGDRFRAIYERSVCEGEVVAIDKVLFAVYNGGGTEYSAIRFDQQDGGNKYWNEKGESMRKAFLKAPLKYNRISSRFSYSRKHPVTGKVRAHTAVDYAAPKGTPVHSIGDGVVTLCGWDSHGGGNRLKIKHINGYETAYLHLSGFAKGIRAGSRVAQGQLIGYVGSTGLSTGPHLDFRVWKDGKPIDPLKMISPPAAPLNSANLDSLKLLHTSYLKLLEDVR